MWKRLLKYLNLLNFCSRNKNYLLPSEFKEDEKIVRSVFSPMNVSSDGKSLNDNTFKPPAGCHRK